MDEKEFMEFARRGAAAQLESILAQFPDLQPARPAILAEPPNGRRKLTADEKRVISRRMKAYWRKRRRAAGR